MSGPNWAKLVSEGRAQAIGVPLTDEMIEARKIGIPKEFYLNGIVTKEAYDEAREKGTKFETRDDVLAKAKEVGIDHAPDAPTDSIKAVLDRTVGKTKKGGTKK